MRLKIFLWSVLAALSTTAILLQNRNEFKEMLSFAYVVSGHHLAPIGVLVLCLVWLCLKRAEIKKGMKKPSPASCRFGSRPQAVKVLSLLSCILPGSVVLSASFLVPESGHFLLLKVAAVAAALFALLFPCAAKIPLILLSTFAFTVLFPVFVQSYFETGYALTAVIPAAWFIRACGLPAAASGQVFALTSRAGEELVVRVSSACAGPATMAVFVAIFILMMLDVPLKSRMAVIAFIVGASGTWFQNVFRILLIFCCGYASGERALWTAHAWAAYVLFPLWYLLFACFYFRLAERSIEKNWRPFQFKIYSQRS